MGYVSSRLVFGAIGAALALTLAWSNVEWWAFDAVFGAILFAVSTMRGAPQVSFSPAWVGLVVSALLFAAAIGVAELYGIKLTELQGNPDFPKFIRRLPDLAVVVLVFSCLAMFFSPLLERNNNDI